MAKAKNAAFQIGNETVAPGESRVVNLEMPALYTMQGSLSLAVHVINGRLPGPRLFVCAAIHGNEINGVEIIRTLLNRRGLNRLRGTLVAIPVVNIFGIIQHSRYLPDGRDLNRSFPGTETGSLASRLAHVFSEEIIHRCTHGIDLHTAGGHRINLPQIRADFSAEGTLDMANAFGVPVIMNSPLRDGSLRQTAGKAGVPLLVYEAGQALRFDPFSIKTGVSGIVSVMRYLQMLPASRSGKPKYEPFLAHSSKWVRAPASGILNIRKHLGDRVRKDEIVGSVSDPSNMFGNEYEEIVSSVDGIVIGFTKVPLVNEGDAIFHIASFDNTGQVAAELENFQDEMLEDEAGPD